MVNRGAGTLPRDHAQRQASDEHAALEAQFPRRAQGHTPNQYILPDGRFVEGDAVLYFPNVIAEDAREAFSDYPGGRVPR